MSSGIISGSPTQVRLPRGQTRLAIVSSAFLTNITIVGNTFKMTDADTYLLEVTIVPSAAQSDTIYQMLIVDETAGVVVASQFASVGPVSAPPQQTFIFGLTPDVTHFYSIQILIPNGPQAYSLALSAPAFQLVVTSLDSAGGGGGVTPTQQAAGIFWLPEIDLLNPGAETLIIPVANGSLNNDSVGIRLTTLTGGAIVTQPTVEWGIPGTPAKYKAATQLTIPNTGVDFSVIGRRVVFPGLAADDAETQLTFTVTVAGAGPATMKGTPYFRGISL